MARLLIRAAHLVAGAFALALYALVVVPYSRLHGRWSRSRGRKPRILWAPVPVINISYTARAERLYGYRSETLVYEPYSINRKGDFDHVLDRAVRLPLRRAARPVRGLPLGRASATTSSASSSTAGCSAARPGGAPSWRC